ncbi:MAG: M23 family metallopeptidase, partial [Phycisphaerales bacterium]|nr:M23 family metallopeptidase [Phycisphaerales bacterium]
IDLAVTPDASVAQGQIIGTVGDDDAAKNNPHLHFEFRKGTLREIGSVHPLGYLPYTDTPNFSPPVADRFNRLGSLMAARLLFGASSRLEGDLKRVEVDLKSGATLLECRFVDFDNKKTVNEGNSDEKVFKKDIGVEGYQKSPMNDPERLRNDLEYGILVRNIPTDCNTLIARVIDMGNNIATSAEIAVPDQVAVDELVDFEDGAMPPAGWKPVTSRTGSGTTVTNDASAAHSGSRGMLCVDDSTTETNTQRAGIELTLPAGRFEWIAEGWFNPIVLELAPEPDAQSVFLLYFLSEKNLSVAARIRNHEGLLLAGIVAKEPDGTFPDSDSAAVIAPGWRKWQLHLLRIGTRETTAVLYLDEDGEMVEQDRLNWDSTASEPTSLRAGIGLSSAGAKATVLADELRVSESLIP